MATTYSLTDGTTTITLDQASGIMVTGFTLDAPEIDTRALDNPTMDGGEIANATYRNVTQTIELLFIGASTAALQTLIRSVENLLYLARRRQQLRAGARVYLQIQIDGEASTWRSEILSGVLRLGADALRQWIYKKPEAQLIVTRRFYWEGPEKELQLSTSTQSAATGGRTIKNHDDIDAGDDNWVQIAAAQVGGELPTPVKLTLTNNYGSSIGYRNFYFATNAYTAPTTFHHMLEGEDRKSGYGSLLGSSNASQTVYNAYTFTTSGEIQWALTSAFLNETQGRWFRLLARFFGWTGTNIYVKPVIKEVDGLTTLWSGDEVKLGASGTQIVDLGAVPLPPGGYGAVWGDATFSLVLRATGAATLNVDFIQLTPLDSYRHLVQRGNLVDNAQVVTDDNIVGVTYGPDGPIYSPKTGELVVFPGVAQRIIILQDEGSTLTIAHSLIVRAYIRERRLTA